MAQVSIRSGKTPNYNQVSIRIPTDWYCMVKSLAREHKVPANAVLRQAVENILSQAGKTFEDLYPDSQRSTQLYSSREPVEIRG